MSLKYQIHNICNGDVGMAGSDGIGCSVANSDNGTKTITCADGSQITLINGNNTVEDVIIINPSEVGTSRSNPIVSGETVNTGLWRISIINSSRGEEAWNKILEANQFNDPANLGMEYILLSVSAQYVGNKVEGESIGRFDFRSTGDFNVLYGWLAIVAPSPSLDADLFNSGTSVGYIGMNIGVNESNPLLVLGSDLSSDGVVRYLQIN